MLSVVTMNKNSFLDLNLSHIFKIDSCWSQCFQTQIFKGLKLKNNPDLLKATAFIYWTFWSIRVDASQADVERLRNTDYHPPSAIVAWGSGEPRSLQRIHTSAVMVLILSLFISLYLSHTTNAGPVLGACRDFFQKNTSCWLTPVWLMFSSIFVFLLSFCFQINPHSLDVSVDISPVSASQFHWRSFIQPFQGWSIVITTMAEIISPLGTSDAETCARLRSVRLTGN